MDEAGLFVRRVGEMLKTKKIVWVGERAEWAGGGCGCVDRVEGRGRAEDEEDPFGRGKERSARGGAGDE